MKKLKVNRFLQKPAHCAVAASATLSNFYNKYVDYEVAQNVAKTNVVDDLSNGLSSSEICKLLNCLGFKKVTLVSSNLNVLDYEWANLKKEELIEKLDFFSKTSESDYVDEASSLVNLLQQKDHDNNIIIDYDFSKYIKDTLDKKIPLMITFNWTMFFKFAKCDEKGKNPIHGDWEEHAVVAHGYNNRSVFICDSHYQYYKYKLKQFKKGFYKIKWEHLMSIIGFGDVIIPEHYKI